MIYVQKNYSESERAAALNRFRKEVCFVLLIYSHLNGHLTGTTTLFLKWKRIMVQQSAVPLLQSFVHVFAFYSIQNGRRETFGAILCAEDAYLRSI